MLLPTAVLLLDGLCIVQSMPSSFRSPPSLPKYYPSPSSPRKNSLSLSHGPSSSLAPTSPVYVAQRLRSSNDENNEQDSDNPYFSNNGDADYEENPNNNGGFVEPIDFSGLLKDVGNSPKIASVNLEGNERSNSNPLFTSESKDNFQGFLGSNKNNPFENFSRLNSAPSNLNSRQENPEAENIGFVDSNVQFRSLFDSSPSAGFQAGDFLGSTGSQTRAYPSFTYSGRQAGDDDYSREAGPARYRSSYRQVGGGVGGKDNEINGYYNGNSADYYEPRNNNRDVNGRGRNSYQQDDDERYNDRTSASPYSNERDTYPSNPSRSSSQQNHRNFDRSPPSPRYSQQSRGPGETSSSPQSQSKETSGNPRCKRIEKNVEYSADHESFTDPEPDYDPSTYRGRYKRQARQRSRAQKRPMVCFVCEDESGRYAEKCSFDSNASPNDKGRNYFHAESSSFSDNGNGNGRGGQHNG